jgi:hypothetical protein
MGDMVRADRQKEIPSTTSNMARQVIQAMVTLALPRLEWAIDQARVAAETRAAALYGALQRRCDANWRRFLAANGRARKLRNEIADQWGKSKLKVLNDLRTQVADLTALCMEKQQVIRNLKGQVRRWETLEPAAALEVRATPSVKQLVRNAAAQVNRKLAAEAGGRAVVRKYGKKHMSKLGVKGGIAAGKLRRAQKRANLTTSHGRRGAVAAVAKVVDHRVLKALKGGTGVDD